MECDGSDLTPALSRDAIPDTKPVLSPAEVRLGVAEVARELRVHPRTARRRLAAWHTAGSPRVERERSPRGEPRYTISSAELARAIPELNE